MNPIAAEAARSASVHARRIAAGVLVTDELERVLLLQPASRPTWKIPGAAVEVGESPRAAARRATREELGTELGIGRLLVVDWVPEAPPQGELLVFVYEGGTLDAAAASRIRLSHADLNAYGFVDIHDAVGLTAERLERRIKAALVARQIGRVLELEDGWRQPLEPRVGSAGP